MNTTFSIVTAGLEVQTLQSSLRQVLHLTPVSMRKSRHKIAQDRILYCFEEGSGTLIDFRMFVWQKELGVIVSRYKKVNQKDIRQLD